MISPAKPQHVTEDPAWERWQQKAPEIYENIYYRSNRLVAAVNFSGHHLVEKRFGTDTTFANVLEVGAGTGIHLDYVRHRFDRYVMSDINPDMLAIARGRQTNKAGLIEYAVIDAVDPAFPPESFDRIISIYNLEHLERPHLVLERWKRILRPGGVLSIAIPAEGGIPWNLGRHLTTRRSFAREGLDLDYIISREHINACYRLAALIRHYFPRREELWYPLRVPSPHLNLVFACNCFKLS